MIAEDRSFVFQYIVFTTTQQESKANVLLFSSSIKSKTFSAINNALTISNLNKKSTTYWCGFEKPQLHDYFNIQKNTLGLSNFLSNKNEDWKSFLKKTYYF
jgi:hypothetical protein